MRYSMTKPDVYHQEHPVESKELIRTKLVELNHEMEKLPLEEKKTYCLALERSPILVSDNDKLAFLRCEVFHADRAAKRLATYWDKRLELFGPDKAFLPLTLDGALKDDMIAMGKGFVRLLPTKADPGGRNILFMDPSRQDRTQYSTESMARVSWYMIHVALQDESTQKKGLLAIFYPQKAKKAQVDRNLAKFMVENVRGCLPVRLSAVHVCHPPIFFRVIYSCLRLFLRGRLGHRIYIHTGPPDHVLKGLEEKFGMVHEYLPIEIGGGTTLEHDKWLIERRRLESM